MPLFFNINVIANTQNVEKQSEQIEKNTEKKANQTKKEIIQKNKSIFTQISEKMYDVFNAETYIQKVIVSFMFILGIIDIVMIIIQIIRGNL